MTLYSDLRFFRLFPHILFHFFAIVRMFPHSLRVFSSRDSLPFRAGVWPFPPSALSLIEHANKEFESTFGPFCGAPVELASFINSSYAEGVY